VLVSIEPQAMEDCDDHPGALLFIGYLTLCSVAYSVLDIVINIIIWFAYYHVIGELKNIKYYLA